MVGDNTQRFAGVFIDDSEHFVFAAATQPVMNEINAPDMIGIFRPQADDGAVFVIKAFAFLMTLRQLQTFFSPQPFNLLMIDGPAFNTQQLRNFAITVAAVLFRQSN